MEGYSEPLHNQQQPEQAPPVVTMHEELVPPVQLESIVDELLPTEASGLGEYSGIEQPMTLTDPEVTLQEQPSDHVLQFGMLPVNDASSRNRGLADDIRPPIRPTDKSDDALTEFAIAKRDFSNTLQLSS